MRNVLCAMLVGFIGSVSTGPSHSAQGEVGVSSDYPAPSPSGTEVVFSADFDGPTRLWAAGIDGSNLRKISRTPAAGFAISEIEPSWSPDGRHIAYVTTEEGVADIWVMQADGTYPVKLTANGANNSRPAWSPDGRTIVFVSDKEGTKDIWLMNADGTGQRRIVGLPGEENRPSFSPAGDKLVFSETADDGSATLMVVNADGSGSRSITSGNFQDWDPHWGANGIVFASNRDPASKRWKLWSIQPDGSGLSKLRDVVGLAPTWTRDGRVVFTDEGMVSRALAAVSVLNPATGTKRVLVNVQGYLTPVDVRPGETPNNVNPQSRGKVWGAILSTKTFDAPKSVNQSTITFGRSGDEKSLSSCSTKNKDVNADGLPDVRCRFWLRTAGFQIGDTVGIVRFLGTDGVPYEGRDVVAIVTDDDPTDLKDDD